MSNKPRFTNLINIDEVITLDGGEDGYYSSITVHYYNQQFFVYDAGNKTMFVYNIDGDELYHFGKEGNGPGEFSRNENFVKVVNDRIIMISWNRMSIYDLTGNFINEVKILSYKFITEFNNLGIFLSPRPNESFSSYLYSYDGKLIEKSSIDNFNHKQKQDIKRVSSLKDRVKQSINSLVRPFPWRKFNSVMIRNSQLNYRIDFGNEKGEIIKSLVRDFDRVPIDMNKNWNRISTTYKDKKKTKIVNDLYQNEYYAAKNGFESDIHYVLGYYKSYLLVYIQTRSNENQMIIDVISEKDEFLTQINVPIPKNNTTFSFIILDGDYLICHFNNDEIGPYAKVYKLSKN